MTARRQLPPRRRRILDFIREFSADNGIPPTVRDIQKACDISSTSVVDYNLRILDRDRYLSRRPDVARGIELLDEAGQPVSSAPRVHIVGSIAAGLLDQAVRKGIMHRKTASRRKSRIAARLNKMSEAAAS